MPRGHSLSIYAPFSGNYYIQTRHNDLFSHYNPFLGKLKEKLAQKARRNTVASISDRAQSPPGHPIILLKLIQCGRRIGKKVCWEISPRVMLIRLSGLQAFQYLAGNCQKLSSFFSFFGTIGASTFSCSAFVLTSTI